MLATLSAACPSPSPARPAPGPAPEVEAEAKAEPLSIKELVTRSKPAIVRIISQGAAIGQGVGTGFIVLPAGGIITNLHVIAGADLVTVQFLDGTSRRVVEVMAYDYERDLALIRVEASALPSLVLADSDAVAAGDPVVAIGNPLGVLDYTVSDGLVSSVREITPALTLLQISAPISQGSSGGPLFNPKGEVIGVVRAFITQGQNLNFGIPSNYVRALLAENQHLSLGALNAALAEELAKAKAAGEAEGAPVGAVERHVPLHDVSLLAGCAEPDLVAARDEIERAIALGAPLYNEGNHEACFRIYEGTASRLERESPCPGVRDAMGQGLLRANTLGDSTRKAWALRDAFDGLLHVIMRKLGAP